MWFCPSVHLICKNGFQMGQDVVDTNPNVVCWLPGGSVFKRYPHTLDRYSKLRRFISWTASGRGFTLSNFTSWFNPVKRNYFWLPQENSGSKWVAWPKKNPDTGYFVILSFLSFLSFLFILSILSFLSWETSTEIHINFLSYRRIWWGHCSAPTHRDRTQDQPSPRLPRIHLSRWGPTYQPSIVWSLVLHLCHYFFPNNAVPMVILWPRRSWMG